MKALHSLLSVFRGAGLVGLVLLILYVESRCLGQNFSHLFDPYVHLLALFTLLVLPPFWILLCIVIVGTIGRRMLRKRTAQSPAEN